MVGHFRSTNASLRRVGVEIVLFSQMSSTYKKSRTISGLSYEEQDILKLKPSMITTAYDVEVVDSSLQWVT